MSSARKIFTRLAVGFSAAVALSAVFSPAAQAVPSAGGADAAIAASAGPGARVVTRTSEDVRALAYRQVRNAYTGRCLAVRGFNANAFQIDCTPPYNDQYWEAQAAGSDVFRVKNLHTGQCLAVQGANNHNGAPAFQNPCASYQDQLWRLLDWYDINGSYLGTQIVNYYTGRALAVLGSNNHNGAPVFQYDRETPYGDQLWYGI